MTRVLGFIVVGLALTATASARAAESIALLPLELAGGLEGSRSDLEAAVVKGLAVAGRRVVLPAEPDQRAATYQVSARISRIDSTFEVRMRLRRAGGADLNTQENRCDVIDCSVAELARRSARELVRQALGRADDSPAPVAPPAAVEPPREAARPFPTLGAVTAGAGAAAIAAGIYFLAVDSKCTSTVPGRTCKDLHDTKALGIGSLAGGALLGGLGVFLMVHDGGAEGPTVAVGVRRTGLLVSARF